MKELKKAAEVFGKGIEDSRIFLSVFTKNYKEDPKAVLQLGIAILLDKPLALVVVDNEVVPESLKKIAFAIEYVKSGDSKSMQDASSKIILKMKAMKG